MNSSNFEFLLAILFITHGHSAEANPAKLIYVHYVIFVFVVFPAGKKKRPKSPVLNLAFSCKNEALMNKSFMAVRLREATARRNKVNNVHFDNFVNKIGKNLWPWKIQNICFSCL